MSRKSAPRPGSGAARWGSASLVSLAHGTNDAQKTMGIIFLALMSYGSVSKSAAVPPLWVIVGCALAMATGTYLGGWRIIRTLGKGLVEIKSPQGMAAESSSAAVILLSAHFGYALSTTQVCTGSVLGSGLGKPGGEVRWGVAGRMAVAWLVTLPLAGLVGAVTYWIVHLIGGYPGAIIGFWLLVAVSAVIYVRSRKVKVDHKNVNAEWEGSLTAGLEGSDDNSRLGYGPKVGAASPRSAPTTTRLARGTPHEPLQRLVQLPGHPEDPALQHAGRCRTAGAVRTRDPAASRRGRRGQRRRRHAHARTRCWSAIAWAIYALVVTVIVFALLYISRDFIAHHTGHPFLGAKPK